MRALPARTVPSVQDSGADRFPDDLTGQFWAALTRADDVNRWRFTVYDCQDAF